MTHSTITDARTVELDIGVVLKNAKLVRSISDAMDAINERKGNAACETLFCAKV